MSSGEAQGRRTILYRSEQAQMVSRIRYMKAVALTICVDESALQVVEVLSPQSSSRASNPKPTDRRKSATKTA